MRRPLEQVDRLCGLDDLSCLHDIDPVAQLRDHTEVMGDDGDRHVSFLVKTIEGLQNLELNSCVERGRRLVGEKQFRDRWPARWRS